MNKSQRRFLGILILLALAGVGGYYAWRAYLAPGLPDGFASSNGRNEATEIDIASKIAGRVEEILVDEGDFVGGRAGSGQDGYSGARGAAA